MSAQREIDATPGAHSFLDALGVVSFRLACGCRIRPRPVVEADRIVEFKSAGSLYECSQHGDQVITRAHVRLVGWADAPPWRSRKRA